MTEPGTIAGPGIAREKSKGFGKTASLYRMSMPLHLWPAFRSVLRRKG